MRLMLLALALFYAWLPSGMCACRLQAALLPAMQTEDGSPINPADDDDDDPHECHCAGAKPLCHVVSMPCLDNDDAMMLAIATVDLVTPSQEAVVPLETANPPFFDSFESPLYLTLRALRI